MADDGREGGFIHVHRQLLSSPVWLIPEAQFKVWITLLLSANWKATRVPVGGAEVVIPRGSILMSEEAIGRLAGVHRSLVQRALATLKGLDTISFTPIGAGAKGGSTVRMINIVKYEQFQTPPSPQVESTPIQPQVPSEEGKKGRKKKEDPQLTSLVDGMKAAYQTHRGEVLDIQKAAWGDLAAVRGILADDGEVLRRYTLFVADKYWPIKSINKFRKAFQHPKFLTSKPSSLTLLPGILEFK